MNIPSIGKKNVTRTDVNLQTTVYVVSDVSEGELSAYREALTSGGFVCREERREGAHLFAAYALGGGGVFLNYHGSIGEMTVVTEENTLYFSYENPAREPAFAPQISQIHLEDFGMSYAIRLSDGRYIVIDGGRFFRPDAERLYECISRGSAGRKPIIAAWIMTHPHADHCYCFLSFMELYGEAVEIESFMLNFPEADDVAHYPALAHQDVRFERSSPTLIVPKMLELMRKSGAPIYTPHTGQIYRIGDAVCEILASMDDTIHAARNINAASLVIRMELGGQVILWATDAAFSIARVPEKYGSYLRADILQVPHHGFGSGTPDAEIAAYDLICPETCFLPVSDFNAYTAFCTHKPSARYLMSCCEVGEIITGDETRTVTLPYTPPPHAKDVLRRKYLEGRENCGARTWFFSELSTACEEDFRFTVLNTTHAAAELSIDLFFEDKARAIRYIQATVEPCTIRRLSVRDESDVDGDAIFFNWMSLKERGIPEDAPFAIRFMSNVPIVVSHARHTASYHSFLNG